MKTITTVLLLFVAPFSAIAFTFGSERAVSTPVYAPPPGDQTPGAVVTDGSDFAIFWSDSSRRAGLYATRVVWSGTGVEPVPQPPIQLGTVTNVAAAWTGSVYLVVWGQSEAVYAATLTRELRVVKPPYLVVTGAKPFAGALASNGSNAVLAYASGATVRGAIFDADGNIVRTNVPLPVDSGAASVHVVSEEQRYALLWANETPQNVRYRFQRVTASGDRADDAPVTVAEIAQSSSMGIAYATGTYAAGVIERQGATTRIHRFRINAGTAAVSSLAPITSAGLNGGVMWTGGDFIAYWTRFSFTQFELMVAPFAFSDSAPIAALQHGSIGSSPMLATNGRNILAVWHDRIAGRVASDVMAGFLHPSGGSSEVVGGRGIFPPALAAAPQRGISIASSPADALVVWTEQHSDAERGLLLAARVRHDGTSIDEQPLSLDTDVPHTNPSVAWTGAGYFVVWAKEEGSNWNAYGRFIAQNGTVGPRISLGPGFSASVAATATVTLVVVDAGAELALRRFSPQGTAIDPSPVPIAAGAFGDSPQVATNGSGFLVVFTTGSDHYLFGTQDLIDVLAVRVTESGSPDAAPIAVAVGPKNQAFPIVGSDGRDYLVAYALGHAPERKIAMKRVLREGQLGGSSATDDGTLIADARALGPVAIARFGSGYALAWPGAAGIERIEMAKVDAAGTPIGTLSSIGGGTAVALASTGATGFLTSYTRYAPELPFVTTSRAFVRSTSDSQLRTRAVRR